MCASLPVLAPAPPESLRLPLQCTRAPNLLVSLLTLLYSPLKAITLQLGLQGPTGSGSDDLPSRLISSYSHHPPLTTQQTGPPDSQFPRCASLSPPGLSVLLWPLIGLSPPPGEDKDCVLFTWVQPQCQDSASADVLSELKFEWQINTH